MNESTNFGLKTTGDNDQWRNTLDYHNENMGVIDAVMAKNQDALGIIVDGNKAAVSATTGQYIILRNSTITGKTDGLYTAAKSIPANTAIDGTYLTAVSGGGLNALNSNIQNLIKTETINIEPDSNISAGTPGTRGAQKQISYNRPSGYTLLGAFVTYMYSSNSVIPLMFTSNNNLYANWYRATSSSISQTEAGFSVLLVYAKLS